MSRTEILEQIKGAEAAAKAKVERAQADQKVAIANARKDAVARIQKAEAEAQSKFESTISAKREELAKSGSKTIAAGKGEAEKVRAAAEKNIPKVKKFLNESIERMLDVAS